VILNNVEWLGKNEVRLFFSTGLVLERSLPCKSAKGARIIDYGMGLKFGRGFRNEWSALDLATGPGTVLFGRRPRCTV